MSLLDPKIWTDKILLEGWTSGGGGTSAVLEPATGATLGSVGLADESDVSTAAARAAEAQRAWAATTPSERARILRHAGDLFDRHAEEISQWLIREAGSVGAKASIEVHTAAAECYEAAALPTHPSGEIFPSDADHWSMARRCPAGVVAVISPFNFPLVLSIRSVAPALALGNSVLLKPDLRTTVAGGVALARVFEEAGLPPGVLQLLPGGAQVGQALVSAREVRVISFTGSTAAGRKVGEAAGRALKRAHLELGGNNAVIVLPGADVAKAASAGAFGSWLHQGQICMSTGRHLVHESIHDEYVAALAEKAHHLPVGDPATNQVALGPVIDQHQLDHVSEIVQQTVEQGARLAAGGTSDGLFYAPTVLSGLTSSMRAWEEEIFGPVAPVLSFSNLDEAVELVNASPYGLSVSILGDVGQAMHIADRIESGKIHINEQTVADEPNAPFGGWKDSGTGSRFGGAQANIEAFTETQWLTVRPDIAEYPF